MTSQVLPKTHRALVLTSTSQPLEVKNVPTPQPSPGSVVAKSLAVSVISYTKDVYDGTRKYPFPTPFTTGTSGIGRIAAIGPDATTLKPGQLIFMDSFIRGRDDPSAAFLLGVHEGHTLGSKLLMQGEWRDATYAEYCKLPLENCFALNESLLLSKYNYKLEDLADIARLIIPFGGLADINVKAGETVIVAPATGPFGMGAVKVALAMGARVIAMGRNTSILSSLSASHDRIETVAITGDMSADYEALKKFGVIDCYFDISPPAAADSTHFRSAMLALRHGGRVSLMGGLGCDLAIPHSVVMHRDLCLRGKWMYSPQNVRDLIKMIESGLLKLGEGNGSRIVGKYGLEEWEKAFDEAKKNSGKEDFVVMVP